MNRCVKTRPRSSGVAAVELALVAPLVLTFAFIGTDFGRVMNAYFIVCNAARAGADYGSTNGFTTFTQSSWEASVRLAVEQELQQLSGYDSGQLQLSIVVTPDADGLYHLAVEVQYPFTTAVNWPGVPAQVLLDHRVEMRRIR